MSVAKLWHDIFLQDRPSINFSFFRIFVALTTGFHVIPSFFNLSDSFLSTALKSHNPNFFTMDALLLVAKSPDWLVVCFVLAFLLSWFFYLVGYWTQLSCIAMTLCCYYFYALNAFHIGTLSWDILLVTLFLMCITPYAGDYFSIDAIRKGDQDSWKKERPFFIQRLLQIQIASTYFYTGLYKILPSGNWIKDNPLYYLANYPNEGVTKYFLLKEWLAHNPQVCYAAGILVVAVELSMPLWLFWRKTRRSAIITGFIFHLLLVLTLDVPTIFLFLFPAQLLLFIDPRQIVVWVQRKRQEQVLKQVIYDGQCGFCKAWVKRLEIMDLFGRLRFEPTQNYLSEIQLIEGDKLFGGFDAFRRFCLYLPMLYPLLLFVYLPTAAWFGHLAYRCIAKSRYCLRKPA